MYSCYACLPVFLFFFFQAEDGIRDAQESRGLGDVYKRQLCVLELLQIHGLVPWVWEIRMRFARVRGDPGISAYVSLLLAMLALEIPFSAAAPMFFADPIGAIAGKAGSRFLGAAGNPRWYGQKTVLGSMAVGLVTLVTLSPALGPWPRIGIAIVAVLAEAVGGQYDNLVLGTVVVLSQRVLTADLPLLGLLAQWGTTLMVPRDFPSSLFFGLCVYTAAHKFVGGVPHLLLPGQGEVCFLAARLSRARVGLGDRILITAVSLGVTYFWIPGGSWSSLLGRFPSFSIGPGWLQAHELAAAGFGISWGSSPAGPGSIVHRDRHRLLGLACFGVAWVGSGLVLSQSSFFRSQTLVFVCGGAIRFAGGQDRFAGLNPLGIHGAIVLWLWLLVAVCLCPAVARMDVYNGGDDAVGEEIFWRCTMIKLLLSVAHDGFSVPRDHILHRLVDARAYKLGEAALLLYFGCPPSWVICDAVQSISQCVCQIHLFLAALDRPTCE
eukprot:TRINITY_DN60067_c0_g1_i1.p1 TRINITY_DN60067_c0_g1~~TRINITY_DN60067_c0_g1_i1.p1  ORF type:complete len:494 (-),score=88.78 TRINITY_DN60067_c0_g1_i1:46-1527(-)